MNEIIQEAFANYVFTKRAIRGWYREGKVSSRTAQDHLDALDVYMKRIRKLRDEERACEILELILQIEIEYT